MRDVIWKLADETFCLADWAGFREAALPGLHPGGALRWVSSLLGTTGLSDTWWWVPYVLLPLLIAGLCAWQGSVGTALRRRPQEALESVGTALRRRPREALESVGTALRRCPRSPTERRPYQNGEVIWLVLRGLSVSPFLLVLASLLHVGTHVWQLPDYAFPMTNLLGMAVMAVLYRVLRGRVAVAGVVCPLAYVPCGLYALLAGVLVLVEDVILHFQRPRTATERRPYRPDRPICTWSLRLAALVLLVATPWLAAAFVYGDVATGYSFGSSQSILNGALLEPFGFWPIVAFALFGWELLGKAALVRLVVTGMCCALVFVGLPNEDLGPQFRMERLIREGRYDEALAANARDPAPLRMSLAYRVLALWRTGRLETELFARPFTSFHRSSQAEELKMDGQVLLFEYGFLLPARQRTMECVASKGWQPDHLRLMGDAAFLTGERALAVRNWRQLARCPFHGAFARRRLEGLMAGKGLDDPAFADLRSVAELHATWRSVVENRPEPPFYFLRDSNVENFVYGRLLTLKGQPPPEVARLAFAAYLLEKDAKALVMSRGMMDALCPEGPWPKVWQQGTLAYLGSLLPAERDALVATLRAGVFTVDEAERYDRFVLDVQGSATNGVDLLSRYGDTYYFYDAFVK